MEASQMPLTVVKGDFGGWEIYIKERVAVSAWHVFIRLCRSQAQPPRGSAVNPRTSDVWHVPGMMVRHLAYPPSFLVTQVNMLWTLLLQREQLMHRYELKITQQESCPRLPDSQVQLFFHSTKMISYSSATENQSSPWSPQALEKEVKLHWLLSV